MSSAEGVLAAAFALLSAELSPLGVTVLRDEYLPQAIPPAGLVILRPGESGDPDICLNPRTEYYQHRAEVEIFTLAPIPPAPTKEETIYAIFSRIEAAVDRDPGLGGTAIFTRADILELETLDIEGAPEILAGTFDLVIEYETQDLLV